MLSYLRYLTLLCAIESQCGRSLTTALSVYVIADNEDRTKKISVAIKPVAQNRVDFTDNITDIRNVFQGFRLSPTLQVSVRLTCALLMITTCSAHKDL